MKTCSKCKESKALDCFTSRRDAPDGLMYSCKNCSNARSKEYRSGNQAKCAEYQRIYRVERQDEVRQRVQRYIASPERRATLTKYRKAHPEVFRIANHLRRARVAQNTIEVVPNDILSILVDLYGNSCMYPGCERVDLTLDHIIPVSKGGPHAFDNFQILCKYHNTSKGNRNSIDYRPKLVDSHV